MSNIDISNQKEESKSDAKHILFVEDDPSNAEMIQFLLQSETPYQVLWFASGEETLSHLDEIRAFHPLLFLLDYHLQSMTAFDLSKQLHQIEGLEDVPVLMISAHNAQGFQMQAEQYHIKVLTKPFDLDEFLQAIEEAMN